MDNLLLTDDQERTLGLLKNGENLFLTGPAGTGKSLIIKKFKDWCVETKRELAVTATTGKAALLIGGTTIYSWAGIGLGEGTVDQIMAKIKAKPKYKNRWWTVKSLIIDEISMMSPEIFEKLECIARRTRYTTRPFGGIQLIVVGDFCQLPPVNFTKFCFESDVWDGCLSNVVYLREVLRQSDPLFQNILDEIRMGGCSVENSDILKSYIGRSCGNKMIKPTKLYSRRDAVDTTNKIKLKQLKESGAESRKYKATVEVLDKNLSNSERMNLIEKMSRDCPAEDTLEVAVGAQVILLKNLDLELGLVNGSRGVVLEFTSDGYPLVLFLNGKKMEIKEDKWEMTESLKPIVAKMQVPLKLGYAVTIHSSQGATMDCVKTDLGASIFEYGQLYTALSRVRTLEGLSLVSFDEKKVMTHPKVLAYYEFLTKRMEKVNIRIVESLIS